MSGNPDRRSRRAGVLGVHSVDHIQFAVPDLAEAERFYAAFGLATRYSGAGLGLYTDGIARPWAILVEGRRKTLGHLSFGAFEDDLPRFHARLEAMRIARADPPPGFEPGGLWFRDPVGTLIEIRAAEIRSPDAKPPAGEIAGISGIANAPSRSAAPMVRPNRLAHVLTFTRNVGATLRFYADVLGLRVSDVSADNVGFMHAVHGSDHHVIAFLGADGPGLHHLSWDAGSIQAIGLGAMQMRAQGYCAGWGLGRHVLGSNYFHYVRDPWGSYCEYACDIDYIPADTDWRTGEHPPEDSFYVWGPDPPEDFAVNYEAMP
jgi:catechol 2,3-dioxygenase